MSDADIARRLRLIVAVRTEKQGVQNDLVEVRDDSVVVRSERTNELREIPFRDLRRAGFDTTANGVIVRVLAAVLGLYDGEV